MPLPSFLNNNNRKAAEGLVGCGHRKSFLYNTSYFAELKSFRKVE